MNIPTSITEIEFTVASLPIGSNDIIDRFYQTFKKKVKLILHKFFQKTEEEVLPNSFCKLTKDITRKEKYLS